MKASDIVNKLALLLPKVTDKFTNNHTVTSLTRSGTTVTATTSVAHGLSVNNQANIVGSQSPISISSITRSGAIGTMVTDTPHDMTEGFSKTVDISGANEAEFNGSFALLTVPNRKTVTFSIADSGPTTATGPVLLLNGSSEYQTYNGLHKVSAVPSTTSFEYELPASALPPLTTATGTISARTDPRVSSGVSIDRLIEAYSKQTQGDLWAFVVLGDVSASKSRRIDIDATDNLQRGNEYRQQITQPFSVLVFIPTAGEIAASDARDLAEDLFRPLCQSVLFSKIDSGLYVGAQNPIVFSDHAFAAYNSAFYAHVYNFEATADITFDDTVGYDLDVAFRDIHIDMGVDTGTEIATADIDLDEVQL